MKIVQNFLTQNDCYKTNRTINVNGLMLHSVGCPQPSAQVFLKTWNKSGLQACVHAFIDGNDGTVYQTLPWNHRGWHGGGKSNNTHIGVEMCEPATIRYTGGSSFKDLDPVTTKKVVLRTYNAAVELFADLCKQYKLNPMTDIISHREGHALGIASNHSDPEHLWKAFGLSMDGFRKDVQTQMKKGEEVQQGTSYMVNVPADTDVYSAPAVMQIKKKGIYTIVEEKNGYGKLKSGAGWIKLSDVKKV